MNTIILLTILIMAACDRMTGTNRNEEFLERLKGARIESMNQNKPKMTPEHEKNMENYEKLLAENTEEMLDVIESVVEEMEQENEENEEEKRGFLNEIF